MVYLYDAWQRTLYCTARSAVALSRNEVTCHSLSLSCTYSRDKAVILSHMLKVGSKLHSNSVGRLCFVTVLWPTALQIKKLLVKGQITGTFQPERKWNYCIIQVSSMLVLWSIHWSEIPTNIMLTDHWPTHTTYLCCGSCDIPQQSLDALNQSEFSTNSKWRLSWKWSFH